MAGVGEGSPVSRASQIVGVSSLVGQESNSVCAMAKHIYASIRRNASHIEKVGIVPVCVLGHHKEKSLPSYGWW